MLFTRSIILLITEDTGRKEYVRVVFRIKNGKLQTVHSMSRSWDDYTVNGKNVSRTAFTKDNNAYSTTNIA